MLEIITIIIITHMGATTMKIIECTKLKENLKRKCKRGNELQYGGISKQQIDKILDITRKYLLRKKKDIPLECHLRKFDRDRSEWILLCWETAYSHIS